MLHALASSDVMCANKWCMQPGHLLCLAVNYNCSLDSTRVVYACCSLPQIKILVAIAATRYSPSTFTGFSRVWVWIFHSELPESQIEKQVTWTWRLAWHPHPSVDRAIRGPTHSQLSGNFDVGEAMIAWKAAKGKRMFRSHRHYRVSLAIASFSIVFEHWW